MKEILGGHLDQTPALLRHPQMPVPQQRKKDTSRLVTDLDQLHPQQLAAALNPVGGQEVGVVGVVAGVDEVDEDHHEVRYRSMFCQILGIFLRFRVKLYSILSKQQTQGFYYFFNKKLSRHFKCM